MKKWPKTDKMNYILSQCYLRKLLTDAEHEKRLDVLHEIKMIISNIPNAEMKVIGSFAYNLSVRNGDLDVVCLLDEDEMENINDILSIQIENFDQNFGIINSNLKENLHPNKILKYNKRLDTKIRFVSDHHNYQSENCSISKVLLLNIGNLFKLSNFVVERILHNATFPIIKLRSIKYDIKIDMSINQYCAIENTLFIERVLCDYPCMKPIIVLVKTLCNSFNINSSYSCTLSSYAITLMTIFYFQVVHEIPEVFSHRKVIVDEEHTLFENLKGFFFYYAWIFDYEHDVISVSSGKLKQKSNINFKSYSTKYNLVFCVEDPFITDFNVTRTISQNSLEKIVKIFKSMFYMLSNNNACFFK